MKDKDSQAQELPLSITIDESEYVFVTPSETDLLQMIPVDMIKIDLPLFKKGKHPVNYSVEYVLSKNRNSKLTVIPPHMSVYAAYGFKEDEVKNGIPGSIEDKVYHALIIMLKKMKDEFNLPEFPTQLVTTPFEIAKYGKISRANKSSILKALIKLKNSTYVFENSYYSADDSSRGKAKMSASILNDFQFIEFDSITESNPYYHLLKNRFSGKSTFWNRKTQQHENVEVIVVNLHEAFIKNYQNKKGYLLHSHRTVNTLLEEKNDNVMDLYYFLEKNRNWYNSSDYRDGKLYNGILYEQKKIIRISAHKMANRLTLNWANKGIPKTIIIIERLLARLKELKLIHDYIIYKGKNLDILKDKRLINIRTKNILANTEYEIFFDWFREESTPPKNKDKEFEPIYEINEYKTDVIDPVLLQVLEPYKKLLKKDALHKINEYYVKNNIHYIVGNLTYSKPRAKENFEKYFLSALEGNWGSTIVVKLIEADIKDQEESIKEQERINKEINEKNRVLAQELAIAHNFNVLYDEFIKESKSKITKYTILAETIEQHYINRTIATQKKQGKKSDKTPSLDHLMHKEFKVKKFVNYITVFLWYMDKNGHELGYYANNHSLLMMDKNCKKYFIWSPVFTILTCIKEMNIKGYD